MGLIESEIAELRKLAKQIMDGEISNDKASLLIGVYNQTSKRAGHLITIAALSLKEGKSGKATKSIIASNLIGNGTAIYIDNSDVEVIKCPDQGGLCITRESCLDYSGDEKHIHNCQECPQFAVTRKQIFNK